MERSHESVPAARTLGLVINDVDGEVLVYDRESHHIHHLNQESAAVWRQCTGKRAVSDVAITSGLPEESVRIALGKLSNANLLDGTFSVPPRPGGRSRRALLKSGAMVIAIPTVMSVTAPLAVQAASGGSGVFKCSNQQCDEQTACSLLCSATNICPVGCTKTAQFSCQNFDGPLVPSMCGVFCDCA